MAHIQQVLGGSCYTRVYVTLEKSHELRPGRPEQSAACYNVLFLSVNRLLHTVGMKTEKV